MIKTGTIKLFADGLRLQSTSHRCCVASGNQKSISVNVKYSSRWDVVAQRSAVFFTGDNPTAYEVFIKDGVCIVPHEVLTKPGELFIGIRGVCPEDNEIWATTLVRYKIEKGTPAGQDTSLEPTPGVYQQILARLERIESGQPQGPGNGQNGATFIPSVSDEGVISWTNNRYLPNPNPVNIKGKDGADGKDGQPGKDGADGVTPVKGVDYFTPDEVQEIAEQAAGMVEVPESGGSGGNADFGIEGAEVGQVPVVKVVDENGVPTEWEATEMASDKWELIGEVTTEEETSGITITGNKKYHEIMAVLTIPPIPENPGGTTYLRPAVISGDGRTSFLNTNVAATKPNTKTVREIWHLNVLGGYRRMWDGSTATPGTMTSVPHSCSTQIRDAFAGGGGLVGFNIYWNMNYVFPAGLYLQVWGR